VFDLAAYFERIGVSSQPSVAEIHRAHVAAIPFAIACVDRLPRGAARRRLEQLEPEDEPDPLD
jgi:hypothetical protein